MRPDTICSTTSYLRTFKQFAGDTVTAIGDKWKEFHNQHSHKGGYISCNEESCGYFRELRESVMDNYADKLYTDVRDA